MEEGGFEPPRLVEPTTLELQEVHLPVLSFPLITIGMNEKKGNKNKYLEFF